MNEYNREKVKNALSYTDNSPLMYKDYKSGVIIDAEKAEFTDNDIDVMIRRALHLTKLNISINSKDNSFETGADHWRSVRDIWRHIIYFYPNVSIFDIMHSLYKMYPTWVGGQYCTDINKRTFKVKGEQDLGACYDYQTGYIDEFGLEWIEWKDI